MKQTHTEVGEKFNLFDLCQFGMMMARVVISEEKGSPVDILKICAILGMIRCYILEIGDSQEEHCRW